MDDCVNTANMDARLGFSRFSNSMGILTKAILYFLFISPVSRRQPQQNDDFTSQIETEFIGYRLDAK